MILVYIDDILLMGNNTTLLNTLSLYYTEHLPWKTCVHYIIFSGWKSHGPKKGCIYLKEIISPMFSFEPIWLIVKQARPQQAPLFN